MWILAFVGWAFFIGAAAADPVLEWRREYNQVAASIDTLSRMNAGQNFEELMRRQGRGTAGDVELTLLFWADDEAEVFINGFRVGQTRLTPTRIDIPSLYLRDKNSIQVHCWDTDKVESGFMAGLYIRDGDGGMRPVLVTEEGLWRSGNAMAEVRYYAHSQPDIPGAEVIWGDGLFGEVWLEAEFSARQMDQAQRRQAVDLPPAREQQMDMHEVVSRLVQLQARHSELGGRLQRAQSNLDIPRYKGYISGRLAFTLGRAGRLTEKENKATSERLLAWADALPTAARDLVFRPPRELKGIEAVVESQEFKASSGAAADRKKDYLPPPERRSDGSEKHLLENASMVYGARVKKVEWLLWATFAGLLCYAFFSGHRWWLIFKAEEWNR